MMRAGEFRDIEKGCRAEVKKESHVNTYAETVLRSLFAAIVVTGCATAPQTRTGRLDLHRDVELTLADFRGQDPSLQRFFEQSYGFAVFPTVGKGAVGLGGAYGQGEVYEQGQLVGYASLSQATIGVQLGGQAYSELIFFKNKDAMDAFRSGRYALAAQASAVAAASGAAANADYERGVAVFTLAKKGLMYEASVGGQKFSYLPKEEM
jgi:lipid-binding SYLF domain-containing protein